MIAKEVAQVRVGTKLGGFDGGLAHPKRLRDLRAAQSGESQLDDCPLSIREVGKHRPHPSRFVGIDSELFWGCAGIDQVQ